MPAAAKSLHASPAAAKSLHASLLPASRGSLFLAPSGLPTALFLAAALSLVFLPLIRAKRFPLPLPFPAAAALAAAAILHLLHRHFTAPLPASQWVHLPDPFVRGDFVRLLGLLRTAGSSPDEAAAPLLPELLRALKPHAGRTPPHSTLKELPPLLLSLVSPVLSSPLPPPAKLELLSQLSHLLLRLPALAAASIRSDPPLAAALPLAVRGSLDLCGERGYEVLQTDGSSPPPLDGPACEAVARHALLLGSLLDQPPSISPALLAAEPLPPLLEALAYFPLDSRCQANVLFALFNLCYASPPAKLALLERGGGKAVALALAAAIKREREGKGGEKAKAAVLQSLGLMFDLLRSGGRDGALEGSGAGEARRQALQGGAVEGLLEVKELYEKGGEGRVDVVKMADEMLRGLGVGKVKKAGE
ncbi:hypothetical protein TeGR_g2299 [Tetraparma gracilis]|uniref:Uncharacterized protein n=1 Tax=Tetraparma gracilis TaxID=2962635 RepID=A0ABQ6MB03_9STRA|nr:hypothetical protein TeGR_g2299 [Tetraparma gracilis]